jgi:hypothetical protein
VSKVYSGDKDKMSVVNVNLNFYTEMLPKDDDESLTNWLAIRRLIPPDKTGRPELHEFEQAHSSTIRKFKFAIYHLTIMEQVYGPNRKNNLVSRDITAPQHWAIAEAHSIIFNLYSTLDGVFNEIKIVYNFQLEPKDVTVQSHKLRGLIQSRNATLYSNLEATLYKNNQNQKWFEYFIKLRNRMMHRSFTIFQLVPGNELKIKLPDDPEKTEDEELTFSSNRDLLQYCQNNTEAVRQVIEGVYLHILDRVKHRYGL